MKFLIGFGVLFVIALYSFFFEKVPVFYNYVCLIGLIFVAAMVLGFIFVKLSPRTIKESRELRAARKADKEATKKLQTELPQIIQRKEERIRDLENQLIEQAAVVRKNTIVTDKYKNLKAVRSMIERMERDRSLTLSMAERFYDDDCRRRDEITMERLRREMEQEQQMQQIFKDFERDMNEIAHRKKMEDLERRKLEELKRIREELSN